MLFPFIFFVLPPSPNNLAAKYRLFENFRLKERTKYKNDFTTTMLNY